VAKPCSYDLQPESGACFEDWLEKRGRKLFLLGLQLPDVYWQASQPEQPINDVTVFLDKMQKDCGSKSILMISFGTVFFPVQYWILEALVDCLVKAEIPTLFVQASPFAKAMPDQGERIKKKLEETGRGLVAEWIQQDLVLRHPAVGSVLSHGGHGSTTETLLNGLPLLLWPFAVSGTNHIECALIIIQGDQPLNSAFISKTLGAGLEFLQVRDTIVGEKMFNYPDVQVKASLESITEEFTRVFGSLQGPGNQLMRDNAVRVGQRLRAEHDEKMPTYFDKLLQAM